MTTTNQTRNLISTRTACTTLIAGVVSLALGGWTTEGPRPTAKVDGALDKPAVREVVRANIGDVRDCYNAELIEDANAAGETLVSYKVAGDGSVREVAVPQSTMPARFDRCMITVVATWQFPATGGETLVRYPFTMEPG